MASTIDRVTEYLGTATAALSDVSCSAKSAAQVLSLLGWAPPPGADDIGLAQLDMSSLEARLDELIELRSHDTTSDADLALGIAAVVGAIAIGCRLGCSLRDQASGREGSPYQRVLAHQPQGLLQ